MKNSIFGAISPLQFVNKFWQKKPLLIRQAFPNFKGLLTKQELMSLAFKEEVQSRLVNFTNNAWELSNGPFRKRDFGRHLSNWTLLVQDVNHFLPTAEALLKEFNFIPHARLDDLMVSYAPDGGGVGPHFDSYDVFLLQGSGKRRWQIAKQTEKTLVPDSPLRILKHFIPEQEWILEPGDMLYLPPNYAHNGIAMGECMTYSIGFRAPSYQEIAQEFLMYLQDHFKLAGMYVDPDLKVSKHPGQISPQMIQQVSQVIKKIHFTQKDIVGFLGSYLSEPKSNVFFDAPESPLTLKQFSQAAKKNGVKLDLKTQFLFSGENFFMNGESFFVAKESHAALKMLADDRILEGKNVSGILQILYNYYQDGFITLNP